MSYKQKLLKTKMMNYLKAKQQAECNGATVSDLMFKESYKKELGILLVDMWLDSAEISINY
jgi:hypothetical protein